MRALVVVAAVLLACVAAQPEDSKAIPFLVVSKSVSSKMVVLGEKIDVTVTVTNFGQATVSKIVISDKVNGEEKTKEIESLAFLENATLTYSVTPQELGSFAISQAEVSYIVQGDETAASLRAVSNTIFEEDNVFRGEEHDDMKGRGVVLVLTRESYDRLNTKYIRESIAYLFIGAITVLFPFFMYRTKQNQVDYLIRQSKKKI